MTQMVTHQELTHSLTDASAKSKPFHLQRLLSSCETRAWQADRIGWPALAQSWREDMQRVERALRDHGGAK